MNNLSETKPLNNSNFAGLRRNSALLLACAALSLATGCKHNTSSSTSLPVAPPSSDSSMSTLPTASITADPLAIDLGQTVVLNWRTTNAVSPSNSTNFHLVAKGDGGMTEANVRVTVRAVAPSSAATLPGVSSGTSKVGENEFHAAVADMYFDYDSFELRPDAQNIAAQSAAFLVQHPDLRILIGGYADERGSAEYNLALGENRANAAKTGLVNAGVAPARIRVISYGKEKQFCTESTEACWQENRRAQFTIDR